MFRVLVCGGRDYRDRSCIFSVLDVVHAVKPITELIHGAAPGADSLADEWARNKTVIRAFPAPWKTLGRRAGAIRNQKMLDEGKPQLVIAFPGGVGTADMARRAERANVSVVKVRR
jgi:YspA, cpYpsA-related SLOG family